MIATGNARPMGSHNWPIRLKQRLFVRTCSSLKSFFFKVNLSVCLPHFWSRRSVNHSPLPMDWSTQFCLIGMPRFDVQMAFFEDSPSMWLVYNQLCFGCCFPGAANIIQVYTCCWSSFATSGNSACDNFSGLIDGVRCSVREQVYHQSLIWAIDKHLVDHLSYSSIETCHTFDHRYAIGFG